MYGRAATKLLHQTSWGGICTRHQRYVALSLAKNASSSAGLSEEELVDRIVRVDHAGEVGADKIYEGQLAVLRNTPVGPLIQVLKIF